MALVTRQHPAFQRLAEGRGLAALAACLMLGACAQNPELALPNLAETASTSSGTSKDEVHKQNDLEKATEYWGKQYAEHPRDLNASLNYARNLKAMGEKSRAMAVLQQAALFHDQSRELAGEYGRLALDMDQISVASRLLAAADDPINPDWKVISARGTVFAKQGKYSEAIPFYEHALTLAHNHPSVLSNLALAHAMNGEPAKAETMLRQAATVDPASLKIRQNLALVLGLQGKYDEAKQVASRDLSPEKAAENSDYLRRVVKLEPKAMPAPAPALAPSPAAGNWEVSQSVKVAPDATPASAAPRQVAQANVVLPVRKPNAALAMNAVERTPLVALTATHVAEPAPSRVAVVLPERKPNTALAAKASDWPAQIAQDTTHAVEAAPGRAAVVLPERKPNAALAMNAAKRSPQDELKSTQGADANVDAWKPQVVALSNGRSARDGR